MADPLSITASIITLIQASIQVTVLIKQFRDEASTVDATLAGLLGDVEGFQRVLESMRETVDQSDIRSNLQSTGHTGSHWKNLARSLNDGTDTLQKLHDLLDGISKKTSVLDAPRKLLRLKSASEQIAHYREQIQSSHTALQLSLSTIILWNQVTFQKSTERIPDQIVPTLDKLYEEFRTFGALLNAKIEKLQHSAVESTDIDNKKLQYMSNLRECVRSAADVVSTASTTLNTDASDKISVRYGSDFGDVFVRDANEPMLRWFTSNTVYEYEDVETPLPAPSEASTGDALTEYNSDTDSDLENDLIRSLFKEGMKRKEQGDLTGAARHFRNCLTRFSSNTSYASLTAAQSLTACGVSKLELLEYLTDSYCLLGSWGKAKSTMAEKLLITERQVGKKNALYLTDNMKLAEIMMMNKDYVEAHLQARRSLRGFRKLGEKGQTSYENCLAFLIQICQREGKEDEEEAYTALLAGHVRGALRTVPEFQSAIIPSPDVVRPQSPSAQAFQMESTAEAGVQQKSHEVLLQLHEFMQKDASREYHAAMRTLKKTILVISKSEDDSLEKKESDAPKALLPASSMGEDPEETGLVETPEDDKKHTFGDQPIQSAIHPPVMAASISTSVDTLGRVQDNRYYAPLFSFIDGNDYPVEVIDSIYRLVNTAREDKAKRERQEAMANIDFLETYCRMSGNKTHYSTSMGPSGLTCTVHINNKQWCTASGYATESQAVDAAAAKACKEYITMADSVIVMNLLGIPTRSSDKEVYDPDLDQYEKELAHEQDAGQGLVGRLLAKSYAALRVGRTHPRAAASLLKLRSDDQESNTSNPSINEWRIPSATRAPITDVGTSAPPRQIHDARVQNPETLPSHSSSPSAILASKAGLWACNECKPDTLQYLSENRCKFCFAPKNVNAPDSLNGFAREPSDYYKRPNDVQVFLPRHSTKRSLRRKVVILGDTLCGKTYLASMWSKGQYPSDSEDTVINNFIKTVQTGGTDVELVMWDCNGTDENEKMRRLSYDNTHMLLICFDIGDPDSFANVEFMWKTEAERYFSNVPKVLVGCKSDLRTDTQALRDLRLRETLPISPYAGNRLAVRMRALAYFETSAISGQGLSDLFVYVAKALLRAAFQKRRGHSNSE